MSKKTAASKDTSATEKPVNPADVLATEAAQAASPASAPEGPAIQPDGDEGNLPLSGEPPAVSPPLDDLVVEAIMVVSEVEGFRRAGRAWSRTPITVPVDELSEEQIAALEREPLLAVVYVAAGLEKVAA